MHSNCGYKQENYNINIVAFPVVYHDSLKFSFLKKNSNPEGQPTDEESLSSLKNKHWTNEKYTLSQSYVTRVSLHSIDLLHICVMSRLA